MKEPIETYTYEKVDEFHLKRITTRTMEEIVDIRQVQDQIERAKKQKLEQLDSIDSNIAVNSKVIAEAGKLGCKIKE
jgi:hypothetical protein